MLQKNFPAALQRTYEMIKIVDMNALHIPALAQLEKICFGSCAWTEQGLADELTNDTAHFLVAENEEGVAGYIGIFVVCESCYVSDIAVYPQFRRQGVASALIKKASADAAVLGAQSISLEVRPSNEAAVKLYRSLGFDDIGLRKRFYRDPEEDALIMTKVL